MDFLGSPIIDLPPRALGPNSIGPLNQPITFPSSSAKAIFSKKWRSIKWQFDMYHGVGNLDKAIELLPDKDRNEFNYFTENETSYAEGNMFISNSSQIIDRYFQEVFNWLKDCEKVFGFKLEGYGKIRMYAFLAERFLPYWFKRYSKYLEWPVIYHDINKI